MDRRRSRDGDRGGRDRDDRRGYRSRSRSRGRRRRDRSCNVMSSELDRRASVLEARYRGDLVCIGRYNGDPSFWMVDPHLYDGVLLDERYHHVLAKKYWFCWHYLRRGGVTLSPDEWLRMCMVLEELLDYQWRAHSATLRIWISWEEGGFKDMLVSSLILMARGEGGIDSEAAELESEIAAAKRTRMREAELKRKLGI